MQLDSISISISKVHVKLSRKLQATSKLLASTRLQNERRNIKLLMIILNCVDLF